MGSPTYSVRFESPDDFLVEYADRLRHGLALLPLPRPLPRGSEVRLRIDLPDGTTLFVRGSVAKPHPTDPAIPVRLAWTPEQRAQLVRCVRMFMGDSNSSIGDDPTDSEDSAGTRPLSVLLVDDSVGMRIELGDTLRTHGLRVRVAQNGLSALSMALKRPPDVILTDVEMPEMDGWALARTVRARPRLAHVPVIFLTHLNDDLSRLKGYRLGVDDYLSKSMVPAEIVARIEGVLARRRPLGSRVVAPTRGADSGLHGHIEHVRLGSLLAFLESERRSGALLLRRAEDRATLHLVKGTLECVEGMGHARDPHDRVFELLSWTEGEFELRSDVELPASADEQPTTPLTYLLMEHARREDEAKAVM